ncbi:MAG: magnesium-protoporphyrin IX monomethyl ester anaerobic oxidative cyclase [Alphaproteobacteria bacterium]|nr:magnesium-protoporphyrin IX monomethyl ester anaerobic oxidative cyclase [Alphaproteobacteria bacterium]
MRFLLINAPHPSIGSRIPDDHLPPLGLLMIGGSLLDDGYEVKLLDAEFGPMPAAEIVAQALAYEPEIILFGHSGSTSGHPVITQLAYDLKRQNPNLTIIYGGVFPTYHWYDILTQETCFDIIVRGEGEETIVRLARALANKASLNSVDGIAYREGTKVLSTKPATALNNLDDYRTAWELIDHKRYTYWGGKRAVIMQFSRGCPHLCNYCGQRGFWTRWRHRDPVKFAAEIARLHREEGVELINLADENPSASPKAWKAFLEALIAEDVSVLIVGSTRADDIVRDADILHLYRKAGVVRFLMGMENMDEATLKKIKKGGSIAKDRQALQLLRQHGILSMATGVVGFEEERDRDYRRGMRQLLSYDPDQIQMLYITPHRWTPFFAEVVDRTVIQPDQGKWDYKHQVLATRHVPAWRVLLWVKVTEAVLQLRPKALYRTWLHRDKRITEGMRWYSQMGSRVWPHEMLSFLFRERRIKNGPKLSEFWGAPQHDEEESMLFHFIKKAKRA